MSRLVLQALRLTLPGGSLLLERSDLVLDTRITALVGANGVGKSTLCRVLAGRQTPAAGHVVAHGPVAWVDPAALRNQSVSISEWLGERVADTRLPRWLARLDLAEMDWQRPLASLSGGEGAAASDPLASDWPPPGRGRMSHALYRPKRPP